MTRIGLISDTHSYMDEKILDYLKEVDEIWHAGDIGEIEVMDQLIHLDKPIKGVHGNIDYGEVKSNYPLNIREKIDGVDTFITHIGGYPGRYSKRIIEIFRENPPTLFVCGHSHILRVIYDKKYNVLTVNPGACGKHGFHQIRTMLRFTLNLGTIKDMEVIELGTRG